MTPVVLVGLMGTGKSTVGREIADRTGRRLVDVDTEIEGRTGRTVRELWEDGGEDAYRALESEVVLDALRAADDVVLAAPGGIVLDAEVCAALDGALVVWLQASPGALQERVRAGDHRPLLGERADEVFAEMLRDRAERYAALADATFDTEQVAPDEIADAVVALADGPTGG